MDVRYLKRLFDDPIENSVRVSNRWDDTNAWAFNDRLCALRPSRDSRDHDARPSFDGCRGVRIICCEIRRDAAKVVYCVIGKDNLHARRNLQMTHGRGGAQPMRK
jgi:hypothetical protein